MTASRSVGAGTHTRARVRGADRDCAYMVNGRCTRWPMSVCPYYKDHCPEVEKPRPEVEKP